MRQEFAALWVPVQERGRRTDKGLDILTRVLSPEHVTYEGHYYQLHDVTLTPRPHQQPYPPPWSSGRMVIANLLQRYRQPCASLVDRYDVLGTPEQCLEKLASFHKAGLSNPVCNVTCPADQIAVHIECCAAELLPRLRLA